MPLLNVTKNCTIAKNVTKATSLWERTKGLLGRSELSQDDTLWIEPCNSIHTWFMQFPIDVIFVDRQLRVKKTFKNVKPWRILFPVFGAKSVFELSCGTLENFTVNVGDQLNVVT